MTSDSKPDNNGQFLPMSKKETEGLGWERPDFVLVTGDAYVDHHSFGAAVIGRVLEADGFKVAVLSQPDWRKPESFTEFGRPRLGFLVTSGNLDSMVCHYTAARKPRSDDAYTPGGIAGKRPDRAVVVYANAIRQAYKKMPIVLGGVEASLRRLCHYDYWSDTLKRSIILDAKADLLVYGMGEVAIRDIARRMDQGEHPRDMKDIRGTVYSAPAGELPPQALVLPSHEELKTRPEAFAQSHMLQFKNSDPYTAQPLAEVYGTRAVVQNPPAYPLDGADLDRVYELPFMRAPHPSYTEPVPALEEIRFSLVSSRGCFGACSFCALTFHQGRIVTARTPQSLEKEARAMTDDHGFKGYIHDVGGPTANFRIPACEKMAKKGACTDRNCMFPSPCPNLKADHRDYVHLLRRLRSIDGVKKVFIRSGIRFDYLMEDPDDTFFRELCEFHISGQLKVAPEHVSSRVLEKMGKPPVKVYEAFARKFEHINAELGKKQFLVPYLISSHPGSDLDAAIDMALYLKKAGIRPQQVQDFYPTPGTLSTCMYYTGLDPRTMKPVHVPKGGREKRMQRALLQYGRPENYAIVRDALVKAGRTGLIGSGSGCLIPSYPGRSAGGPNHQMSGSGGTGRKKTKKSTPRGGSGNRGL
ncbi:MAG: YgiQ family radical SAM protein [Spirochaetales bacterium]|nr:YgiQ family radical SAM protein [Spirochaetales bacterium]